MYKFSFNCSCPVSPTTPSLHCKVQARGIYPRQTRVYKPATVNIWRSNKQLLLMYILSQQFYSIRTNTT